LNEKKQSTSTEGSEEADEQIPARGWTYANWRSTLLKLVRLYCQSKQHDVAGVRVGTHTLRKTGYLFAIWGVLKFNGADSAVGRRTVPADVQLSCILSSARHSTVNNAHAYIKDAVTLYSAIGKERHAGRNDIGYWESIHIDSVMQGASISAGSHYYKKKIWELADHYVGALNRLPTDGSIGIKNIINTVLEVLPTVNIVQQLYDQYQRDLNPTLAQQYKIKLDLAIRTITTEVRMARIDQLDIDDDIKEEIKERYRKRMGLVQDSTEATSRKKTRKNPSTTARGSTSGAVPEGRTTNGVLQVLVEDQVSTKPTGGAIQDPTGEQQEVDWNAMERQVPKPTPRGLYNKVDLEGFRDRYLGTNDTYLRVQVLVEIDRYLTVEYGEKIKHEILLHRHVASTSTMWQEF
jgi:hypothetical protein